MNNHKISKIEEKLDHLVNHDNNLIDIKENLIKILTELSRYIISSQEYEQEELIKLYNNIVKFEHKFSQKLQEKLNFESLSEIYNIFSIEEEMELLAEKMIDNNSNEEKFELTKNNLKLIINYLSLKISVLVNKAPYNQNDNLVQELLIELQTHYNLMTNEIENLFEDELFWPDLKNYPNENNIENIFKKLMDNTQRHEITKQLNNKLEGDNSNKISDLPENEVDLNINDNLANDKFSEEKINNEDFSVMNNPEIENKNIESEKDRFLYEKIVKSNITNSQNEDINRNSQTEQAIEEDNIQSQINEDHNLAEISDNKQNDRLARILEDLNKKKRQN